jgi:hypothetical protein
MHQYLTGRAGDVIDLNALTYEKTFGAFTDSPEVAVTDGFVAVRDEHHIAHVYSLDAWRAFVHDIRQGRWNI